MVTMPGLVNEDEEAEDGATGTTDWLEPECGFGYDEPDSDDTIDSPNALTVFPIV